VRLGGNRGGPERQAVGGGAGRKNGLRMVGAEGVKIAVFEGVGRVFWGVWRGWVGEGF
jgi:hypothetical protein